MLLEPRDMYSMCLSAGLLPRNMDISVSNVHNVSNSCVPKTCSLGSLLKRVQRNETARCKEIVVVTWLLTLLSIF